MRARLRWIAGAVLGASLAGAGLLAADVLDMAPEQLQPADVILVLGGDGLPRAARAAALYRDGLAPRVLVSGAGDCGSIRDALVAGGVPAGAVLLECASRSTHENAAFSAPLLRGMHARTVLVVTSWFHLSRALACLADAAPGVRWLAVPALPAPGWPPPLATLPAVAAVVAEEGVKLLWYLLRYGLLPAAPARYPGQAHGMMSTGLPTPSFVIATRQSRDAGSESSPSAHGSPSRSRIAMTPSNWI